MKKPRILFYNSYFSAGGVEVFMQTLIKYLSEQGYDVTVTAVPKQKSDYHHPFGPRVKTVWRTSLKDRFKKKSPLWFMEHALYRICEGAIAAYLSFRHYDILIAAQEKWVMQNAARIRAKRAFAWIHTDYSTRLPQPKPCFSSKEEELQCMRRFEKVVCVSETAREGLVRTLGDPGNLCVKYNPIDVEAIRKAAALPCPLTRPKDKPLVVSVGRLDPEKQYPLLLDACEALQKETDFELWIIGDGTQRQYLENEIAQRKLSFVHLLGSQSNPFHYLAQADLFVSSSVTEGYGLAIQEALILGVPVAAIRCPALKEAFDPRFGAISENTPEDLKRAMAGLLGYSGALQTARENIARYYPADKLYTSRLEDICRLWENEQKA